MPKYSDCLPRFQKLIKCAYCRTQPCGDLCTNCGAPQDNIPYKILVRDESYCAVYAMACDYAEVINKETNTITTFPLN